MFSWHKTIFFLPLGVCHCAGRASSGTIFSHLGNLLDERLRMWIRECIWHARQSMSFGGAGGGGGRWKSSGIENLVVNIPIWIMKNIPHVKWATVMICKPSGFMRHLYGEGGYLLNLIEMIYKHQWKYQNYKFLQVLQKKISCIKISWARLLV